MQYFPEVPTRENRKFHPPCWKGNGKPRESICRAETARAPDSWVFPGGPSLPEDAQRADPRRQHPASGLHPWNPRAVPGRAGAWPAQGPCSASGSLTGRFRAAVRDRELPQSVKKRQSNDARRGSPANLMGP